MLVLAQYISAVLPQPKRKFYSQQEQNATEFRLLNVGPSYLLLTPQTPKLFLYAIWGLRSAVYEDHVLLGYDSLFYYSDPFCYVNSKYGSLFFLSSTTHLQW